MSASELSTAGFPGLFPVFAKILFNGSFATGTVRHFITFRVNRYGTVIRLLSFINALCVLFASGHVGEELDFSCFLLVSINY
jgi:hypothetical protein